MQCNTDTCPIKLRGGIWGKGQGYGLRGESLQNNLSSVLISPLFSLPIFINMKCLLRSDRVHAALDKGSGARALRDEVVDPLLFASVYCCCGCSCEMLVITNQGFKKH